MEDNTDLYGIIVSGGRTYGEQIEGKPPEQTEKEKRHVFETLDALHAKRPIHTLVQGGAKGADRLAAIWTVANEVNCIRCPAKWKKHGKPAGPIRNREMMDYVPELVVVFPGGDGTANMVKTARALNTDVLDLRHVK